MGPRKWFLQLLIWMWTLPLCAAEPCFHRELANELIGELNLSIANDSADPLCDPNSHLYKVLSALQIIKDTQFDPSPLTGRFYPNVLNPNYWEHFKNHRQAITETPRCIDGEMAAVYSHSEDKTIYLCARFFDEEATPYDRAVALMHETRHYDGYDHEDCKRGPLLGSQRTCDASLAEKGAYAVSVEMMSRLALRGRNLPQMQKSLLKIEALVELDEHFNSLPVSDELSALYLVDDHHQGFMLNRDGLTEVANLDHHKVISRRVALAVFPKDRSDSYSVDVFSQSLNPAPPIGAFSFEYNALPISARPQVVDILNLGYLSSAITTRKIECRLMQDSQDTVVETPWDIQAAFSGEEVGAPDHDSIYVTNSAHQLFRIQFKGFGQYEILSSDLELGQFSSLVIWNGQRLALNPEGQVLVDRQSNWSPYTELKRHRFTLMTRPFSWDPFFESMERVADGQLQ